MAPRALVVPRRVGEIDRRIQPDEGRVAAARDHAQRFDRGADRAGLARMRVHVNVGVRHALLDVIDLRFHAREVVLRAALQHVPPAERRHARNLHDILPDVLRQHHRKARQQLLLAVALFLEVHAVGVEEHRAAVAELRREAGLERGIGVVGDRHAELVGHRLQQHAVAGGALVREPEVADLAVRHEQNLDVLPADVADDVHVAEILHRRHHVRDRLDDVHVGAQRFLENIRGVAGGAEADHVERRALVVHVRLDLREQLLRIGDRVALRELVLLRQDVACFVDQHRL